MTRPDYTVDIAAFVRDLFPMAGDYGPKAIIPPFLEAWLYSAFPLPAGDPAARNILDSRSKKQGKSALAGAIALYMAARKRQGEVVIVAADLQQARDRVFAAVKFAIDNGPAWRGAKTYRDVIELNNGSTVTAIPAGDWRGVAGGNYSAVIMDELHTYVTELHRRTYDELIIPPTIKAGCRWISSYAGFIGESELLEEIWKQAEAGGRLPGELPIYYNEPASLLALIDQGEASWRMPWATADYMAEIQASERPNTYARLWLNQWTSSESAFLPEGAWTACYDPAIRPLGPGDTRRAYFGLDASTSGDFTALVGTRRDPASKAIDVVYARTWKPKSGVLRRGKPTVDLDLVDAEVRRLWKAGQLAGLVLDPYQLHTLLVQWEKDGIPVSEFGQTAGRIEADQGLYNLITGRRIRHYGDAELNRHVEAAAAKETDRGYRLVKLSGSRKIDLCVALSMSAHAAAENPIGEPAAAVVELDPGTYRNQRWRERQEQAGGHYPITIRGNSPAAARARMLRRVLYDG